MQRPQNMRCLYHSDIQTLTDNTLNRLIMTWWSDGRCRWQMLMCQGGCSHRWSHRAFSTARFPHLENLMRYNGGSRQRSQVVATFWREKNSCIIFVNQLIESIWAEHCCFPSCQSLHPLTLLHNTKLCYLLHCRSYFAMEWLTFPQAALFASVNYVLRFLKFLKRTTTLDTTTKYVLTC